MKPEEKDFYLVQLDQIKSKIRHLREKTVILTRGDLRELHAVPERGPNNTSSKALTGLGLALTEVDDMLNYLLEDIV